MAIIAKTAASLRIFGDQLDPDVITAALGKAPTSAYRKGEAVTTPNGNQRIATISRWSIKVDRREPGDLDEQIAEILLGTTSDFAVWKALATSFKADVFCGLFLKEENEGLSLSPETTLALGQRGLTLDLDIYCRHHD